MKDEYKLTKQQKFRRRRRLRRLVQRTIDASGMLDAIGRATRPIFDRERRFRETDEIIANTYEYGPYPRC